VCVRTVFVGVCTVVVVDVTTGAGVTTGAACGAGVVFTGAGVGAGCAIACGADGAGRSDPGTAWLGAWRHMPVSYE